MSVTPNSPNGVEILELQAILEALKSKSKSEGDSDPILAVLIKMITEILSTLEVNSSTASNGSSFVSQPKVNPGAPTNSQMSNAIAQLAEALAQLQVLLGKYGAEKQTLTNDNMKNMIEEAQAQMKQAQSDLQKLEDQQSHHSFWDIFLKVVSAIVGAVFAAIACATGQVELAVVIIALTVAAETGAFGETTKLISQVLQAMGVPPKDANIIASVLVIVTTIILTVATCGAAAPEAAADVAEVVADTTAETVETTAETVAEESQSLSDTITNGLKNALNTIKNVGSKVLEYNPFNKFSTATNMAIMTGSQAIMGSNLFNNIIATVPSLSDKQREELEKIMGIITDIICSLASLGAGLGAGAAAGATSTESVFSQSTMKALMLGGFAGQGAGALGNFMIADIDAQEAALEASMGNEQAIISLFQNMSKMNERLLSSGNTSTTKTEAAHTEELNTLIDDLAKAGQTLAQVLSA